MKNKREIIDSVEIVCRACHPNGMEVNCFSICMLPNLLLDLDKEESGKTKEKFNYEKSDDTMDDTNFRS